MRLLRSLHRTGQLSLSSAPFLSTGLHLDAPMRRWLMSRVPAGFSPDPLTSQGPLSHPCPGFTGAPTLNVLLTQAQGGICHSLLRCMRSGPLDILTLSRFMGETPLLKKHLSMSLPPMWSIGNTVSKKSRGYVNLLLSTLCVDFITQYETVLCTICQPVLRHMGAYYALETKLL